MAVIKTYNPNTQQWEIVIEGPRGQIGDTGVLTSATPPEDKNKLWVDTTETTIVYVTDKRFDFVSPYSYCGVAPVGSAEADAVWRITRITISEAGTVSATESVNDVAWTDRYTVTYS